MRTILVVDDEQDLVDALNDVMIPYINGYEILKTMKKQPEFSTIPVVLMSASLPKFNQSDCQWQAFLAKPFELETLLKSISDLIGKAESAA